MLPDLYTIARWLNEYVEIVQKLPEIVRAHGPISLQDILRPSFSPAIMPLGIDASPLNRTLGIGTNWMLRELIRQRVYAPQLEPHIAPYCWMPSGRVRRVLGDLGAGVSERADKDNSRTIYDFVVRQLDVDRARFEGDYDLPLQLITRRENYSALAACYEAANREPPSADLLDSAS